MTRTTFLTVWLALLAACLLTWTGLAMLARGLAS